MLKKYGIYEIAYLCVHTGAVSEASCFVYASSKKEAHTIWLVLALEHGWNYAHVTNCTYADMHDSIKRSKHNNDAYDIIDMHNALNSERGEYIRASCERAATPLPQYTPTTWKGCLHKWGGTSVYADANRTCKRCQAREDDYGLWHPDDKLSVLHNAPGLSKWERTFNWWQRLLRH